MLFITKNSKVSLKHLRYYCTAIEDLLKVLDTTQSEKCPNHLDAFKIVFKDCYRDFANLLYLLELIFNNDYTAKNEQLAKENLLGIQLFNRILFNPHFNIQTQSEFDKIISFFKGNLSSFRLFYLLLTETLSITQQVHLNPNGMLLKECTPLQRLFFARIKAGIIQRISLLKEVNNFIKTKDGKTQKTYNAIMTLEKLLVVLQDCNLFITQEILFSNIPKNNINHFYIFHADSPESFDLSLNNSNKNKLPFSLELTSHEFQRQYFNLVMEHKISTTFKQLIKKTDLLPHEKTYTK